jgi:hypothetical protein
MAQLTKLSNYGDSMMSAPFGSRLRPALADLTRSFHSTVDTVRVRLHSFVLHGTLDPVLAGPPEFSPVPQETAPPQPAPLDDPWIPEFPLPAEETDLLEVHAKGQERRGAARHQFTALVEINAQMAFGWDISETGLSVYVRTPLAIGDEVVASLGGSPEFGRDAEKTMRVVRTQMTSEGYLVGLRIVDGSSPKTEGRTEPAKKAACCPTCGHQTA